MDEHEAKACLHAVLSEYRNQTYEQLKRLLTTQDCREITGPSGVMYQTEIRAVWDDQPHLNLRVMGAIDDGGFRTRVPSTDGFVLAPDDSFIGQR